MTCKNNKYLTDTFYVGPNNLIYIFSLVSNTEVLFHPFILVEMTSSFSLSLSVDYDLLYYAGFSEDWVVQQMKYGEICNQGRTLVRLI